MEKLFKEFCSNIRLTTKQNEDAKAKYKGVCKTLHNSYYDSKYNDVSKFIFGSYKTKTNIRPLSEDQDVDVLFKIPQDTYEKFCNYQTNGQSSLLQEIRDILKNTYTTTDKISGWGKVVLVKTSSNTHNVEILPAFEKENGTFIIPDTTGGGSWEVFDPRKQIEEFNDSNKNTNNLTAELCRMLKSWKKNTSSMVYTSHDLLNDVISFLKIEFESGAEYDSYQRVIKDFLEYKRNENEDEKLAIPLKTAYDRVIKAIELMNDDKYIESSKVWRQIFGSEFPEAKTNPHKESCKNIISPMRPWKR